MKKLLSILGSLGMVATAGMAVVACSKNENKASESYKDFESWVEDSKKGNTDVVFVGGRKDVDTLSFLAAEKTVVDGNTEGIHPRDVADLIKAENVEKYDSKMSEMINEATGNAKLVGAYSAVHNANKVQKQSNLADYFWGIDDSATTKKENINAYSGNLNFHSLLVDDISSFFTNGVGKEMRKGFISDQVDNWFKFFTTIDNEKQNDSITKNSKNIKQLISNSLSESLKSAKGPFFIILNNGNLAGITRGFKNYNQFNTSNSSNKSNNDLTKDNAYTDINNLFQMSFEQKVWSNLYDWVKHSFEPLPTYVGKDKIDAYSDFTVSNKDLTDGWENADSGNTYSKDNAADKIDTTFALDLKKYID